ncbi:MAG: polysaccharide deacetylase family protein [Bacteroidota bacterium]|nr:polysaccharide deacetylase family protein [Bacteroidota bacterium]MDP4251411.1 polysaccharide deacetylase family protein [Bacteroidota bacterium]
MLNHRNVNIFFVLFILAWILLDHHFHLSPAAYAWILLVYVSVLFCGSYFIQLGYFFKSVNSGNIGEKEIALSFDDGPATSYTMDILDLLREKQVESIFFCIGKNIPGNENILKRIVDEGHIIGNHSYSHHVLFDLFGADKMLDDLQKMNTAADSVTGRIPRFFRPPYGVTNPNLKKAVERGGFISIGWSIRSLDTVIRNEDRLMKKVLGSLKPGAILLFHDTSQITVKILPALIRQIQQKGYRIVRLDKMLKLNPYA